jgi:hypothetical protein
VIDRLGKVWDRCGVFKLAQASCKRTIKSSIKVIVLRHRKVGRAV